ncbi:MAG: serine/threonine/tyrosine-interacting-like protein 1 [Edafosvirus sp.]|uniref:Serine/threonine/tyrosine-interacting-like protein 1 n=1 Tax=Edafosvirus sp. TaxID=2487765 RepID=A0A3G4ZTZ8_9VIRU|nr:MAG: serine/threonine/tyrosine-interacting-like protein 1 [Edafosvirus sp.]
MTETKSSKQIEEFDDEDDFDKPVVQLYKCEWPFMLQSDKDYDATNSSVPNLILEDLYHGDAADASKPKLLAALDIKAMICAIKGMVFNQPHHANMNILHIKIDDNPKDHANTLEPYVDTICKFVDENRKAGNKILSFCMMGISRSSSVNIIIIMYLSGWKLDAHGALEYLRSRRTCCKPAIGFMEQLEVIRQKK